MMKVPVRESVALLESFEPHGAKQNYVNTIVVCLIISKEYVCIYEIMTPKLRLRLKFSNKSKL